MDSNNPLISRSSVGVAGKRIPRACQRRRGRQHIAERILKKRMGTTLNYGR